MNAIDSQDYEYIQKILKESPDLLNANISNYLFVTPLQRAAWRGDLKTVQLLIELKVNVNLVQAKQKSALMWASLRSHLNIIEYLCGLPEIIFEIEDMFGLNCLDYAIINNHKETARIIFQKSKNSLLPKQIDFYESVQSWLGLRNFYLKEFLEDLEITDNTEHQNILKYLSISDKISEKESYLEQSGILAK